MGSSSDPSERAEIGASDAVSGGKEVLHYGDVIINNPGDIQKHAEEVKQEVIDMFTMAWNAARTSTPVPASP